MGSIIDQNSNTTSNDNWALITGTTVVNTIISNLSGIEAIQSNYDFLVDMTIQGQSAGIGWTYTSTTDTFAAPPPQETDWITVVQDDFDNIAIALLQCLSDAGSGGGDLSPTDLANAFANATTDSSPSYSTNQATLMTTIYQYILNGG